MAFILIGRDKKNSLDLRLKTRGEHLEYLATCPFKIKVSGPLLDNGAMVGTIILFESGEYEEIKKFVENDPYCKVNLFEKYEILDMKIVTSN